MSKNIDIRKTGPQTGKTLQQENNSKYYKPYSSSLASPSAIAYTGEGPTQSPLVDTGDYWGSSSFDNNTATLADWSLESMSDTRAYNQPWYSQLGAGVAKGVGLAATTFLDGTLGLLVGAGEMVEGKGISSLWDNELSNALSDVNKQMEQWMPNYRTQEEQERPWWQNLGTVNFWADSFIKNLGFTVGAFYSGAAWTKGLQAIGILKGSMAAKGVGSVLSAVNEGRIEANNGSKEYLELKYKEIDEAVQRRYDDIVNDFTLSEGEKYNKIGELGDRADQLRTEAQEQADAMGLTTLMGNTVLLTLDNLWSFGKLYARGFKDAKGGLGSKIKNATGLGAKAEATAAAGENVVEEGGKYAWKDITKGQAIRRGLTTGLVEGNEEMSQGAIQAFAGNKVSYDSPDAYYEALTDPNAKLKTKDTLTALTEAMKDTYGNGDRWEEFAVGFLTGIFGTPTFGKVANSDANTYLGKGKMIGMSGGLFGEIGVANMRNREGRAAVETANKYLDKLRAKTGHFVQGTAFTDAMNGFAEADDKFEFKNAEDNDDFAAISSFAKIGKLNDLKDLVNQDFENMSDEQLADIAMNTSRDFTMDNEGRAETTDADGNTAQGGWRFSDGSLMSDSEEGREMMRNELKEKRDKILDAIDKYEDSVQTVRAIGNNSLDDDQVNELAWLNWKVEMFKERFKDVKEKNRDFFDDLEKSVGAFLRGRGQGGHSEQDIKNMESTLQFIKVLKSADSPLKLASLIDNNFEHTWFLGMDARKMLEGISGLDDESFGKGMRDLWDLSRMAIASKQFNERYKEFKEDPSKLIENRNNIDAKQEKKQKAQDDINLKDKLHNASVSSIKNAVANGEIDLSSIEDIVNKTNLDSADIPDGDDTNIADVASEDKTVEQKIAEVEKMLDYEKQIGRELAERKAAAFEEQNQEALQAIEDLEAMFEKSASVAESLDEMIDTNTQAFNDFEGLEPDQSVYDLMENGWDQASAEAEVANALQERIEKAKSLMQEVSGAVADNMDKLEKLPSVDEETSAGQSAGTASAGSTTKGSQEETKEVGHDSVSKVETENERRKKEEEEEKKREQAASDRYKQEEAELEARRNLMAITGGDKNAIHALNGVIDAIEGAHKKGLKGKDLADAVKNTDSYKHLVGIIGDENANNILNKYNRTRQSHFNSAQNAATSAPSGTQLTEEQKEEDLNTPTPEITVVNVNTYSDNQDSQKSEGVEKKNGNYQFWFPSTREFAMGREKGEYVPFHVVAKNIKKADGTPMYSKEQLQRMEAVFNYLQEKQAFTLVNNGAVQGEKNKKYHAKDSSKVKGDVIHFVIDPTLNENAREVVVLLADSEGRIIGDLGSPRDVSTIAQAGLLDFYKRILKEYEESGNKESGEIFTSKESSIVDKNMVGKVPYYSNTEKRNTLNQVFTEDGKEIPFKIGIAVESGKNAKVLMTPGKTRDQGKSKDEQSILPPLTAVKGQPYLLLPTSDKTGNSKWIPVPFSMPRYNTSLANTAMGKAIHSALELIKTSNNTPMVAVRAIRDLIANEVHISYSGEDNSNVRVTVKPHGSTKQIAIYSGPADREDIVTIIEKRLERNNVSFQVSRKYYNTTYNGQDYNRMIGEIAEINLPKGATHTIGDWFTIKPLTSAGKTGATKSPRTTGKNPNSRTSTIYEIKVGDTNYNVNVISGEVTDSNGNIINTPEANIAYAHAYGIHTNKDMQNPYETQKGYYHPRLKKFIEKKSGNGPITNNNGSVKTETQEERAEKIRKKQEQEKLDNEALDIINKIIEESSKELSEDDLKEVHNTLKTSLAKVLEVLRDNNKSIEDKITALSLYQQILIKAAMIGIEDHGATKEEMEEIDDFYRNLTDYSYYEAIFTPFDEDDEYANVEYTEDENLPEGARIIIAWKFPTILKGGKVVQKGFPIVAINSGKKNNENENAEEPATSVDTQTVPSSTAQESPQTTQKLSVDTAEQRVAQSKLLHKEDILDVTDTVDGGLNVSIDASKALSKEVFDENPNAEVLITEGRDGKLGVIIQGTKEALYPSKEQQQKVVDRFIPKEMQDFFNNGGRKKEDAAKVALSDKMRDENPKVKTADIVKAQNSLPSVLRDKFGIPTVNESTNETNILEDEQVKQSESPQVGQIESSQEEGASSLEDLFGYGSLDDFTADLAAAKEEANKKKTPKENEGVDTTLNEEKQKPEEIKKQEDQISDLDKAKKADLLNTPTRQAVWGALNEEQQHQLATRKVKQKAWMRVLEKAYDPSTNSFDESILGTTIDKFFDKPKFRKETSTQRTIRLKREQRKERAKEIKWIKKALPQLGNKDHLRIHKGLIKISDDSNPSFAYGMFYNGVMTISDMSASGTVYHEAFHAVTDMLLDDQERDEMFNEAKAHYGDLGELNLEENLAEDFRRYMQLEEKPVIGKLVRLFRTLKRIIQNITGNKPYIDRVFYNISRGKYRDIALSQPQQNESTKYLEEEIANEEMRAIKEEAIANGTFMKAPNGKDTRLTERQWLQVRTQAFKNWFGDWENDPANASKVVDENGEPKVVHHGSPNKNIRIFDASKSNGKAIGSHTENSDKMNFFVDNVNVANAYSDSYDEEGHPSKGETYAVFLNIRNPKIIDYKGGNWDGTAVVAEVYDDLFEEWVPLKNKEGGEYFATEIDAITQLKEKNEYFRRYPITDRDFRTKTIQASEETNQEVEKALVEGNYDGVILKNVGEVGQGSFRGTKIANDYVTFNTPNQIKSATDNVGTFSRDNDDIRYMMAGVRGISNLDFDFNSNNGETRIKDLITAKKMEKDGKDALAIKRATGWEKGADGKWRYELPDITLNGGMLYKEVNKDTGVTLISDLVLRYGNTAVTQLLKAYPRLKWCGVKFVYDKDTSDLGSYSDAMNNITINLKAFGVRKGWYIRPESREGIESTLVHEIQHAIQHIEGFAEGGSPEWTNDLINYWKSHYPEQLEKINKWKNEVRAMRDEKIKNSPELQELKERMNDFNTTKEEREKARADLKDAILEDDKIKELLGSINRHISLNNTLAEVGFNQKTGVYRNQEEVAYEIYRRLAGEAESRTVEKRHGLTDEERRNSLFMDDLYKDVAEDDLVLINGTGTTYNMAPGFGGTVGEFQDIVDSNINNPTFRWRNQATKNNAWGRLRDLWYREGYDVRGYKDSRGNWRVASVRRVQSKYRRVDGHTPAYESTVNRVNRIRQNYKDKMMYANLSDEDKQYLKDKHITIEEYNNMTDKEKEVLFKCKGW